MQQMEEKLQSERIEEQIGSIEDLDGKEVSNLDQK